MIASCSFMFVIAHSRFRKACVEDCAISILVLGCKLLVLQLCVTAIAFDCRESKQQEFFCVKNLSRRDLVRKTSLELVSCCISRLPSQYTDANRKSYAGWPAGFA